MTMSFQSPRRGQPVAVPRLAAALAPARTRHRDLIEQVSDWVASNPGGAPVDPDLLALVLLGRETLERWYPANETRGNYWTRTQTNHLLAMDIPNVCSMNRIPPPMDDPQQLWHLLNYLDAQGLFHFDSDPIEQLREPLHCYAGLDESGLPRPEGKPTAGACRCYWPTRKQLELGLEKAPTMPDEFAWFGPEREAAQRDWHQDVAI